MAKPHEFHEKWVRAALIPGGIFKKEENHGPPQTTMATTTTAATAIATIVITIAVELTK